MQQRAHQPGPWHSEVVACKPVVQTHSTQSHFCLLLLQLPAPPCLQISAHVMCTTELQALQALLFEFVQLGNETD